MTLKKSDICTNFDEAEDKDILTRPLFAVNMRLFKTSPKYKKLVLEACEYIAWCCQHEENGQGSYIGYSGANAGIPWDIIAVMRNHIPVVMINATWHEAVSSYPYGSWESCGSLPGKGPFLVNRQTQIHVDYYDIKGKHHVDCDTTWRREGCVIQHEVDHNDGILLTDRAVNNA